MPDQNPQQATQRPVIPSEGIILDCAPCSPESPSFSSAPPPHSQIPRNPIAWARTIQLALLCLITVVMIGATRSQYDRIGHKLICSCGCNQILLECNHIGCPTSPGMIRELHAQVATGAIDKSIFQWFAAKYGPTILAAPMRGGFDDVAWIVPLSVFVLATAGTFTVVWLWKRRASNLLTPAPTPQPFTPQDPTLRDRIRRETEY